MTNIAGTSFSREGKGFVNLKAMPVKMSDILTAKIRHSMIYFYFVFIVLAIIYIVLTLCIPLPLTVLLLCKIFAISYILSYSAVRIITSVDIMLDLANPKMEWENPVAAFKQNMNVLFSILISWGFIALFALLFVFVVKENVNMLLYIGAGLLIISGFINRLLYKYADKRYSEI
jgi:ABC-2 type transport system permease protein